jgi:hypothetical protein
VIGSRRDAILIAAAAAALLGAGVIFWTGGGAGRTDNPDFPEGHAYICADCGCVTVLSDDELFEIKKEARRSENLEAGRVLCAECGGANVQQAMRCPHCGEYFPRPGRGRPVCPHCNEPYPSQFDD